MAVINRLLIGNFFSLGFVQVITSLLQLLVVPFVVARIGVENYGVVAVAQVVMFYLATLIDYGFNQTATREVSLNRQDSKMLSSVFSRVLYAKLFLCAAAFAILMLLAVVFPFIRHHFFLYCMAFIYVPGSSSIPVWFMQGLEKMNRMAAVNLLARLIFVAAVFIFIREPGDAPLYVFLLGGSSLLCGLISSIMIFRKHRLALLAPRVKETVAALRDGWQITASNLSMNIIQYGNIFILRLFTNDLVTGYYGVAERIFFSAKQVLVIFSQAVYPRVCQLAAEGTAQLALFLRRVFVPFLLLVMAGSILLAIAAPYVLDFFLREVNADAVFVLQLFCVVLPVVCLNIPGSLALLAFNMKRQYFMIYGTAVILCIAANLVLARLYQVQGTVAAIMLTELFITITAMLALNGLLKKEDTHL